MIRTYRYGGQKEVEKDGQKATIQIPPPTVLAHMGPVIQVSVTHPRIIQEQIKLQNKEVPGIQVNALIDTGASNSVVTPKIADSLKLVHTGFQKVASVMTNRIGRSITDSLFFLGEAEKKSRSLPAR